MASMKGAKRNPHLRLMELRINQGWSPNDLAFRAQVSGKTIRMIEAGWIPGPRVQFQVAAAFGMKPLELWPFDRDRQKVAA